MLRAFFFALSLSLFRFLHARFATSSLSTFFAFFPVPDPRRNPPEPADPLFDVLSEFLCARTRVCVSALVLFVRCGARRPGRRPRGCTCVCMHIYASVGAGRERFGFFWRVRCTLMHSYELGRVVGARRSPAEVKGRRRKEAVYRYNDRRMNVKINRALAFTARERRSL